MKASHIALGFWTVLSMAADRTSLITVRLYDYAGVPAGVIQKAELEAQRVLGRAGVEVQFAGYVLRDGRIERRHAAAIACCSPADLLVTVVPPEMARTVNVGHSMGYALLLAGQPATRAFVLYERVLQQVRNYAGCAEFRLLGYVIAHEIAHLLLGDARHPPSGIMAEIWRKKEMRQIEQGMLEFSKDEVRLLKAAAMTRAPDSSRD